MGGTIFACGPDQAPNDTSIPENCVMASYSYRGFADIKVVVLQATIDFLSALSGKQISKKVLVDEGIVMPEAAEGEEEAIVIANYRARIAAAIALLKSWQRTPAPEPPSMDSLFGGSGDPRILLAALFPPIPLAFEAIHASPTAPSTLVELRLAGIHALIAHPDGNGSMPYDQAKDTERLLRVVKPYCKWSDKWVFNEGDTHIIDEMIAVFEAVPPGGTARN
ncbi:hypothetical protein DFH06DRAFT_1471139 [Mycena polygramma]|nr:hypothetical protein DFH06DRAFT_1471139 [Mycena polygramma]